MIENARLTQMRKQFAVIKHNPDSFDRWEWARIEEIEAILEEELGGTPMPTWLKYSEED